MSASSDLSSVILRICCEIRCHVFFSAVIMAIYVCGGVRAESDFSALLVREGKPAASIVVAKNPSRSAAFAAVELQYHIHKITTASLPIVTDDVKTEGLIVLVGESERTRSRGFQSADFKPQEYLIRFEPNVILLMGREMLKGVAGWRDPDVARREAPSYWDTEDNGPSFAVYDFLERCCGVRWYAPTELGMVYPTTKTLEVRGEDVRRTPAFEFRLCPENLFSYRSSPMAKALWNNATNDEISLWAHRLRLGGKLQTPTHGLEGFYDRFWERNEKNPTVFEGKHPEYFAKGYEGVPPQLCYTDPAMIKQVAQDARNWFDGRGVKYRGVGYADWFAIEPMDNGTFCKCAACQAPGMVNQDFKDTEQFSTGLLSNYIFGFANNVALELKKTHPDKYIALCAYYKHARYPTNVKLEPNIMVALCLATRNWWCPVMERADMAVYDSWVKRKDGRRMTVWCYYLFPENMGMTGGFHVFPGYFAHTQARQLKMFHRDGIRGMYCDGGSPVDQVDAYVLFKLLNDPSLDIDELLHEFFTRYYGEAAGVPLERFYRRVEEIYMSPANYPKEVQTEDKAFHQTEEIAWGYLGTRERMAELGALVAKAKAVVPDGVEKQRFELFEQGVWNYMLEGHKKYQAKLPLKADVKALENAPAPSSRIPKAGVDTAKGNCAKVNWAEAAPIKIYRTVKGYPTDRNVRALALHDGKFLYLRLEDATDGTKLISGGANVFYEDHWEIFFAAPQREPYHQLGISVTEEFKALTHSKNGTGTWKSSVKITSTKTPQAWILDLSIPLRRLASKGCKSGDKLYFNAIRGVSQGAEPLAWSPTFSDHFQVPNRLGELTFE